MGCDLIRLGIVDDHPVYRLGLKRACERQRDMKVLWDLGGPSLLLDALAANPVDIVLIDLDLGAGQDGLSVMRALVKAQPQVKVVAITASLDAETVGAARRAGARGYLSKDLAVQEMLTALRRLAAPGAGPVVFVDTVSGGKVGGTSWGLVHGLTKREREVLSELKRGRTNREIASRLGVSVTTINKHVQQVLKKLHVRNRSQAVARMNGETGSA